MAELRTIQGERSPWIFGRKWQDFSWFFLPGIAVLLANFFITESPGSRLFAAYFFFDSSFAGSGHIYATIWRTYLNPAERRRSSVYIWVPLACFMTFFSWSYFGLAWLVHVPAYLQFWHHMRQSFGIQKWYQRQNNRFTQVSDFFLYLLITLPFLIFHFREPTSLTSFLLPEDLLLSPNPLFKNELFVVYLMGLGAWVLYELFHLKYKEWNRLGFMALTIFLNGFCFITGRNEVEILFPLVAYHGFSYFGLVSRAMVRTQQNTFTVKKALFFLALTALVFGTYERLIEFKQGETSLFLESMWAGVYITPILCHYIFDGFLWRAKHPESKQIYSDK